MHTLTLILSLVSSPRRVSQRRRRTTRTTRTRPRRARPPPPRPPQPSPPSSDPTEAVEDGGRPSQRSSETVGRTLSARSLSTRWTWAGRRSALAHPPYVSAHRSSPSRSLTCILASLNCVRGQASAGNTLALQTDSDGNVNYAAIAQQGQRDGKTVQSSFKGPCLSLLPERVLTASAVGLQTSSLSVSATTCPRPRSRWSARPRRRS